MTAIGRIVQLKRDGRSFGIRLADEREFWVESGGSIGVDISANGRDSIIVFDAIENRQYRIPVAAIARILIPEDLDDQGTWIQNGSL
jgi:hypothetical protein